MVEGHAAQQREAAIYNTNELWASYYLWPATFTEILSLSEFLLPTVWGPMKSNFLVQDMTLMQTDMPK